MVFYHMSKTKSGKREAFIVAFEQVTPPGNIASHAEPLEAPVQHDRSFFDTLEPIDHVVLEADAKMDYEFEHPESTWLPPKKYRKKVEPFETPLNALGLVDSKKLIELVLETIDPAHDWRPMRGRHKSVHHLQWPEAWYSDRKDDADFSPALFRDLAINKRTMPREFENWLHKVTLPPPVPEDEVMRWIVRSWQVNKDLFKASREIVLWEKRTGRRMARELPPRGYKKNETDDSYSVEWLAGELAKHAKGLEQHLNELERIPQEFRLVEPANNPSELAKTLGKIVMPRALPSIHVVRSQSRLAMAA
jgi:hypothetical protein